MSILRLFLQNEKSRDRRVKDKFPYYFKNKNTIYINTKIIIFNSILNKIDKKKHFFLLEYLPEIYWVKIKA